MPTTRSFGRLAALLLAATLLAAAPAIANAGPGAVPMQEPQTQEPAQEPDHAAEQEGGELDGVQLHDDEHAEDEEHAAEPKPWFYWPAKWFNFIALSAFLYWMLVIPPAPIQDIFSFPGLRVIFAERSAAIIAARDLAAQQKQEAAQMLVDSEQRLAKIEEEVSALVIDARGDAEREQQRALEDGKAQAAKILEVAGREVNNEGLTAQRQLRGFVADLAVKMAEKNLAEHLTAEDQDRLIREYLSRLGESMA